MANAHPVVMADLHPCLLGGRTYVFRTPDVYDPARARRLLARQRVRRGTLTEFRLTALAGVAALAAAVGDAEEGERQAVLVEEFYQLLEPIDEDTIDEPDLELRAAEVARREAAAQDRMRAIGAQILAIQANLERHWGPYAELKADSDYWDEVSRIDMVRLLLVSIDPGSGSGAGAAAVARDDDGLASQAVYHQIPAEHRMPLATFAFGLLAPGETQRKN